MTVFREVEWILILCFKLALDLVQCGDVILSVLPLLFQTLLRLRDGILEVDEDGLASPAPSIEGGGDRIKGRLNIPPGRGFDIDYLVPRIELCLDEIGIGGRYDEIFQGSRCLYFQTLL